MTSANPYEIDFPLYPLFGFFEEERVWKGVQFSIQCVIRGDYQSFILHGTSTDVAIKISDIQIGIPKYDVVAPILQSINNQIQKDIEVNHFHRRYIRRQMDAATPYLDWELGISNKRARYLFVWFKPTNRIGKRVNEDLYYLSSPDVAQQAAVDNQDILIPAINEFKIKDIRLTVDDQYYPVKKPLVLDPSSNDINDLVQMYKNMTSKLVPQYETYEFLGIHGIVCFDLSAQKENKGRVGLRQILSINKDGNQSVDIHCLILEENATLVKPDETSITNVPI